MQVLSYKSYAQYESVKNSLTSTRLTKYTNLTNGDLESAIDLYRWNTQLSSALYIYVQGWEVCLRNKVNDFLCWKYNSNWHYDEKHALRQMKSQDRSKVRETVKRQQQSRQLDPVPLSMVVADLSAGFWVSQVSKRYEVPYAWRYNLARLLPNTGNFDRHMLWSICDNALTLRNRIAHHEPIFHLPLLKYHGDLRAVVGGMCEATQLMCDSMCTFEDVWRNRPHRQVLVK